MNREGFTEGQQPNTGNDYEQYIIDEWIDISQLGRQIKSSMLSHNFDPDLLNPFIAGLCDLLMQLKPKVKGRKMSDPKLAEKFMEFSKKYAADPQKINDIQKDKDFPDAETKKQELAEIEETIRAVLEELGITEWGE